MKNYILFIFTLFIVFLASVSGQAEEERIRENVSVVNVEVPVRVFFKGKPVDHLTRKDFKLYEDKKIQTINGFFLKRKKIKFQNAKLITGRPEPEFFPTRFFALIFRLSQYTSEIKRGIDYLFEKILMENDQVLVMVNDQVHLLNQSFSKTKKKAILDQLLRKESIRANQRLIAYFTKIQNDLKTTKTEIIMRQEKAEFQPMTTAPAQLVHFLKNYLITWKEYKRKYFLPDINRYYNFAKFLEKIYLEKWIINFYQIEMFPKLKQSSEWRQEIDQIMHECLAGNSEAIQYARMILNLLTEIDFELNAAIDFNADEISKLFYKVNATFHSIFCSTRKETSSLDLEYRKVSTDIENSLREITAKTGGSLIASNDLESALHTLSEREDIYYMLTYAPQNPQKTGKIKVAVNNKKYKVVYDNNIRANYIEEYLAKKRSGIPEVYIDKLSFTNKKLSVDVCNFQRQKNKIGKIGRINVRVRIKDEADLMVFNKSKILIPEKKVTNISIIFSWLKKGKYNIVVDVTDLLTGKTAMNFLQPQIQ